jgi:hypothetical protein
VTLGIVHIIGIVAGAAWLAYAARALVRSRRDSLARDIRAIASHITRPGADLSRELIPGADQPPAESSADVFTSGELAHLKFIEQWIARSGAAGEITARGQAITCALLEAMPGADPVELGRALLALVRAAEYAGGPYPNRRVFTDALAAAALDLTDIERSVAS